ncbi:MAG: type 4a pilus biogenesis protein PilO [Candidatus Saccharibacteria bacterium]
MARVTSTTKRSLITKANSTMVVSTGIAAFVAVFCLIASKTLISQAGYQNRIIGAKKTAVTQLKANINARDSLVSSYAAFVGTPQNVLSGNPTGSGAQDGDNAKIVLDALPSKYDFPALATSLEKIITSQNLQILGITGTDNEATQTSTASGDPQAIAMPFQVQVSGSYDQIKSLVQTFGSSIRPFQIQTVELSGSQNSMTATITAQTFFQPEKTFKISSEVVK